MSDPNKRGGGPSLFELLREPAMRSYLFVAAAALLAYYVLASARTPGGDNLATLLAVVVAVPGLLGRWTISPALFLILSTYLIMDPNFGNLLAQIELPMPRSTSRYSRSARSLEFSDLLLAASILVYFVAQFRLLSLVHKGMPDDPPPRRRGQAEPAVLRRPANLFANREVSVLLLLAGCCTIAGFLGWLAISAYAGSGQQRGIWGVQLPSARLLLFGWSFASISALTAVFFRYRALCRMSRREARLLLQDSFWLETRREQERIYRWRRWFRKRSRQEP